MSINNLRLQSDDYDILFTYDNVINGDVLYVGKLKHVKSNLKALGSNYNFKGYNCHYIKKDHCVFVTIAGDKKYQLIVTPDSDITKCHSGLLQILERAFDLRKDMNMCDLQNFLTKTQKS
jgi:hypothetical protein